MYFKTGEHVVGGNESISELNFSSFFAEHRNYYLQKHARNQLLEEDDYYF